MNFSIWLAFFITATVASFVPGPAVLYVVGQGMRHGARKAIAANLGILSGNAIWFTASAIGLAALVAVAAPVFNAIRWLGVAYLTWLGISAWREKNSQTSAPSSATAPTTNGSSTARLENADADR